MACSRVNFPFSFYSIKAHNLLCMNMYFTSKNKKHGGDTKVLLYSKNVKYIIQNLYLNNKLFKKN
jgi:type IV secretory pathway VirB6-like protein